MRKFGYINLYTEQEIEKRGLNLHDIDWLAEFENIYFSEQFILKWKDVFDKKTWICISKHQKLSVRTIHKLADYVDWHEIALSQKLTEHFIETHLDKLDWFDVCLGQRLSELFIEKHKDEVDWNEISFKDYLTIPFVRKFEDRINWRNFCQVCRTYYNNWDFLREFAEKLDWEEIYEYIWEKLKKNISIIREFQDYIDWDHLEEDVVLKKNELREFWDHITYIYEEDWYKPELYRKEFKEKMICEEDD